MRASAVMAVAVALYVVHRWATDKPAITAQAAVGGLFAIAVIALLDQGKTEEIAKGFAWLFFAAAAYNAVPDISKAAAAPAVNSKNTAVKPS